MKLKKSDYALIILMGLVMAGNVFVTTFSLVDAILAFIVTIPSGLAGAWLGWKIREKVKRLRKREH